MNDNRRVVRSRTRAVMRRPASYRSCEDDETDDTSASDQNGSGSPVTARAGSGARCRGGGGYCSDSAAYGHAAPQRLPPIGVYWDIENCQIPRGKSAVAVAQVIRDQFFSGYRETEFVVVCDVKRESPQVIQDLENAQVNVIHVGSQSKNAADEKLRQSIRRFADTHGAHSHTTTSAAVVLISGDVNFAPDLCDLRHRQKIHVILVHNDNCSESLIMCASETYNYSALVAGLPLRKPVKAMQPAEVVVSGLPLHHDPGKVRGRLKRLAENCGGRVGLVAGATTTVRFPSMELGIRAQKRMDNEDVFGSRIIVGSPTIIDERRLNDFSPSKNANRRALVNGMRNEERKIPSLDGPRGFLKCIPPFNNVTNGVTEARFRKPFPVAPFNNQENVPNSVNSKFNDSPWETIQNKQPFQQYDQRSGGRPILGRQHTANYPYEHKTNEGYTNGRHSLDSMLDFELERDAHERERQSNATFQNWLKNSTSNLDQRRCQTPPLGINTSIPPPPIVNLPRSSDKYFFHPIQTNGQSQSQSQSSPSPASSNEAGEPARCSLHSRVPFVDSATAAVTVRLGEFSARLTALVTQHGNRLPLASLRSCYESQFAPLPTDGRSVVLEHVVTAARSCELVRSGGVKYLRLNTNMSPTFSDTQTIEGPLVQFSKDIQALLKSQPKCQIAFDQVISVYNRMFSQPCRMSDYGCTKLIQLLEKLPSVVQVMGEGVDRVVTLTHNTQMQRFTADLTRVLQTAANKQVSIGELPQLWLVCMGRTLQPVDYGLCYLEDLLDLVPTSCAVVSGATVALPRAAQRTPAQLLATDKFAQQVVELLSHTSANFSVEFGKFCPAYHRHFGVQCKLSDYGFTKLADLFEAITHVVTVEGQSGVLRVCLTVPERLKVLSGRILELVGPRHPPELPVDDLLCAYLFQHGHALRPDNYGCDTLMELLAKLPGVKVITNAAGQPVIIPTGSENETIENKKQNYFSQPKVTAEVKVKADKIKPVGGIGVSSAALLNLLRKASDTSTVENGQTVNTTDLHNLKPAVAAEAPVAVTLLPPEQFLRPPSLAKSPVKVNGSVFPSSPDASVLPKPVALAFPQVTNGFDNGSKLLQDLNWNKQNGCVSKQRVKTALQFGDILQHK